MEKKKKPTDINQLAYQIVQEATQEVKEELTPIPIKEENPRRRISADGRPEGGGDKEPTIRGMIRFEVGVLLCGLLLSQIPRPGYLDKMAEKEKAVT